jgi:hypothetical protein
MTDETQQLTNEGPAAKYFATIPHIADDELGPYAYRLYGHYVRVCGQGNRPCTEKTTTTATKTSMSAGAVSKYRRELEERGYIQCEEIQANGTTKLLVTLCDIWPQNMARYAEQPEPRSPHERARSPRERADSSGERARSSRERADSPSERADSPSERARSSDEHARSPDEHLRITNNKNNQLQEKPIGVVVEISTHTPAFANWGGLGGDTARRRDWALQRMAELKWQNRHATWSRLTEDEQDNLLLWLWCHHFRHDDGRKFPMIGDQWEGLPWHLRELDDPFDGISNPGGWIRWNLAGGEDQNGPPILPDLHEDEIKLLKSHLLSDEDALYTP